MAAEKPPRFLPAARAEFLDAIRRYETGRDGLGTRFLTAIERALEAIAVAPERWPLAPGVAPARRVRRYVTPTFPFAIYYHLVDGADVEVVAVAHQRRRPGYWARRIR